MSGRKAFSTATQAAVKSTSSSSSSAGNRIAFIDGGRIPFAGQQTIYKDKIAYDLARLAVNGIIQKTALDKSVIDYVTLGSVISEVKTSNLAREVLLGSNLPKNVPAHTVSLACISSNVAMTTLAEKITCGQATIGIAGGAETFSDVPIRFSKPMRERMIGLAKASKKGPKGIMKLLSGLKLKDLAPETPAIANFSTGEVMLKSSDRLSSRMGVYRPEMDAFALASHKNAAKAHEQGLYKKYGEIFAYNGSTEENLIKADTTMEKMAKLKPVVKPHGSHTAANSSPLTDGASACIISSESKAKELGLTPKAYLKDHCYVAVDPFESMLLGPAYGMAKMLAKHGLTLGDIDVFEIHEAFAGQVLSNLAALESEEFCRTEFQMDKIGAVPHEKLNQWGGSVSVGHPFGATGTRIVTTAVNRLIEEDGKLALVAACADGGQAVCQLIERA